MDGVGLDFVSAFDLNGIEREGACAGTRQPGDDGDGVFGDGDDVVHEIVLASAVDTDAIGS